MSVSHIYEALASHPLLGGWLALAFIIGLNVALIWYAIKNKDHL